MSLLTHPNAPLCSSDPELWFSDRPADKAAAKAICLTCPLLADCRDYGKTQEYGIWGGVESLSSAGEVSAAQFDKQKRNAQIEMLTREGYTAAEIATRLGISDRTVTRVRATFQSAA